MDRNKFSVTHIGYLIKRVEIMAEINGDCEDLEEIVNEIADEIRKERGPMGAVHSSDVINYVTRHQERYPKFSEIIRYCLSSFKAGDNEL
jgi:hypothetical protein